MRNYFISLFLAFILLGIFVSPALAQISQNCRSAQGGYCIGLAQTYIPGLEFLKIPPTAEIGEFLTAVYYFLIGVVGLSAFIAFTVGGVMYLFSAGSEKMTSQGRIWMWNAVYGLAIAMVSWLVLYTINPDLVLQLNLQIKPISGTIKGTPLPPSTEKACRNKTTGVCTRYVDETQCGPLCSAISEDCVPKGECTGPLPVTWYYWTQSIKTKKITCIGPFLETDCKAKSTQCFSGLREPFCQEVQPP